MKRGHVLAAALCVLLALLVVSGLQPYDRLTWALEVTPVVLVMPVLLATRRRFPPPSCSSHSSVPTR